MSGSGRVGPELARAGSGGRGAEPRAGSRRALAWGHPDFAGHGEAPGLRLSASGRLTLLDEDASVRQALLLLLTTAPGERVHRPDYGCPLHRLAFAPNDDTTAGLAMHYVRRAIERWEPGVEILAVDAGPSPDEPERLEVRLEYRVRATARPGTLGVAVPLGGGSVAALGGGPVAALGAAGKGAIAARDGAPVAARGGPPDGGAR